MVICWSLASLFFSFSYSCLLKYFFLDDFCIFSNNLSSAAVLFALSGDIKDEDMESFIRSAKVFYFFLVSAEAGSFENT